MPTSLPANPSLENLKKQSKTLKRAWQAHDADALRRIRAVHPRFTNTSEAELRHAIPRLADCQLVLAREAGFNSWPQLKVAIQSAARDLPDQFISLACLCFDDPHYDHRMFHARAHEVLRTNPWLAGANIWTASTAGNTAAVRAFLDDNLDLINSPGPYGWVPLICACYSRAKPIDPVHSSFDVAKLLLDRGADPNAYTIKGNADERLDQTPRHFTALTGVFGGGSTGLSNEPQHPRWRELAELLLERGADPADEEAIAKNPAASLEILLRHGLKPDAIARRHTGNGTANITLMGYALAVAALRGNLERVNLLLANGARTGEIWDGKTPWQHAMAKGHLEIARTLDAAGAPTAPLDELEQFVSLCLAGDRSATRALLDRAPDLVQRAPKDMAHRAVGVQRKDAVELVLDLGFDPNWIEDNAAIHIAGVLASQPEILRILLQRGASLTLREPWYDGTAIGWADFGGDLELRDKLLDEPGICLFDALQFNRLDRIPDILERDPAALERPFAKCLTREPKPEDWQTPLMRMIEQGKTEAVRALLEYGPDITSHYPDGRTLLQLARDKGFHEIADLLRNRDANAS